MTRSTFTSEGAALILAADSSIVLRTTLHEVQCGRIQVNQLRSLDVSTFTHPLFLVTDAMNLLLALDGSNVKQPAEKSFLLNLLWLRDKLIAGEINGLLWSDTRDMTADGLTKGSVSRDLLHGLMACACAWNSVFALPRRRFLQRSIIETI